MKLSYADSGVNIDCGNKFVESIKPITKKTFSDLVYGGIGSFSGGFKIPKGYKEPILLASTDGVGTKLRLAIDSQRFDTIGIDLVAMCVNDIICNFGKPLFFLDYYATGKLNVEHGVSIIEGIAKGCLEARCSLIGGESAEMPGIYKEEDFDLAGFCVGIAESEEMEKNSSICAGDLLVALPSSGLHSNGYSLARKVLFEVLDKRFEDDFYGRSLIDVLLEATKIYVNPFLSLKDYIKGLAHITGGGIVENLPRALPKNLNCRIKKSDIKVLDIFKYLSQNVEEAEMFRTFNMGIGMIFVVSKNMVEQVLNFDKSYYVIGEVIEGCGIVEFI